ncbi:MAG: helix-turn-helix transcriptional regulator [Leptolyngbya sp. SIOISBB]|nr:helix-turn-helix transcriptional regulator [Leptolyngbya sp. SIOISBB]
MTDPENTNTFVKQTPAFKMTEDVLGCKWSLTVLQLVRQGISRPGSMVRSVEGLTTKVLNERLRKLMRYKILKRHAYPEIPPRVEYRLTPLGEKFIGILDQLAELDEELESEISSNDSGITSLLGRKI